MVGWLRPGCSLAGLRSARPACLGALVLLFSTFAQFTEEVFFPLYLFIHFYSLQCENAGVFASDEVLKRETVAG